MNHYEEVSDGNKDDEDDYTSNVAGSQDEPCTIPYCNCLCHKKKGPAQSHLSAATARCRTTAQNHKEAEETMSNKS